MKKLLSQAADEKELFNSKNKRSETSLMISILDGISNRIRLQKAAAKNSNSKTKTKQNLIKIAKQHFLQTKQDLEKESLIRLNDEISGDFFNQNVLKRCL